MSTVLHDEAAMFAPTASTRVQISRVGRRASVLKASAALLLMAVIVQGVSASESISLHPAPVLPGQPAFVRIDQTDRCFEFDQFSAKRDGNHVVVEIIVSDFLHSPCLPQHVTPVLLPIGAFDPGIYAVEVYVCGNIPIDPCGTPTHVSLRVGAMPRTATVPVFGIVALLLSCSGILALAFTGLRGPSRR